MSEKSSLLWEILRKTIHLSGLGILVVYTFILHYLSEEVAILVLTFLLLVLFLAEYIRIEHKPKIVDMFSGLFREHEKNQLSGAVYFLISSIIAFAAFDYWVALLAMFMIIFGDFFAAIVGRILGGRKIYGKKTWAGTIAEFLANLGVGFIILPQFYLVILAMAFTSTLVELLTNKLDDNLMVPLTAGFVGQMIVYIFGLELPKWHFTFFGLF